FDKGDIAIRILRDDDAAGMPSNCLILAEKKLKALRKMGIFINEFGKCRRMPFRPIKGKNIKFLIVSNLIKNLLLRLLLHHVGNITHLLEWNTIQLGGILDQGFKL